MLKHSHIHILTGMSVTACLLLPLSTHAQVYRCGNSYSSSPCAGTQSASADTLVDVHTGPNNASNFEHTQHRRDAREWERTERELDKAQTTPAPQHQPKADRSQCQAKQQRIQKIDALARKGGSVKQMERFREERQNARDWQFRAGC